MYLYYNFVYLLYLLFIINEFFIYSAIAVMMVVLVRTLMLFLITLAFSTSFLCLVGCMFSFF